MLPLPATQVIAPVMACSALPSFDLAGLPEAPTRITAAEETTFRGTDVCLVKGYIAPQIQFEMRLPLRSYTGRFLQTGCGGNCGVLATGIAPACDEALAYGGAFAVATDNSGHVGGDLLWAGMDSQLRIDFAYRSEHVMALAAKVIVNKFYGKTPAHSFYMGCSNGGRQALQEAQRYPQDFDGLIAGAPAVQIAEAMERFAWESHVGLHSDGTLILKAPKLALLHAVVLRACDAADGLEDGEIADSRQCHFDPETLACKEHDAADCLTQEESTAARLLYQGPVDASGRALFTGGEPYGSELTWGERGSFLLRGKSISEEFARYMTPHPESLLGARDAWKFDVAGLRELQRAGDLVDSKSADLRALRDRHGKIVLWQGAADPAAGPYIALDYFQAVQKAMGGPQATSTFARFFLVPGVYHCGGGYIPYQEDLLGALVRWVEQGDAPDRVLATAVLVDGTVRTRPVFAYPTRAVYRGSGDIDKPESFEGVLPQTAPDDEFHWAGMIEPRKR